MLPFILQAPKSVDNFEQSAWKLFKPNVADRPSTGGRTFKFRSSCDFTGFNGLLVGLILLSGDIATHPGPYNESFTSKANIKCLAMNARSLKSLHYSHEVEGSVTYNLHCFQDLVYTEDLHIVLVNETWLHRDVENSELLYSGYSIYRKDRVNRRAGGVLISVKTCAFKSVTEFPLADELQDLEIASAAVTTASDQKILFCSCYRPPNSNPSWVDLFNTFLNQACDQFENMVICGVFYLPNISWDSVDSASGANKLPFIEVLQDHFLTQINSTPTRGNNILDLVITSAPDRTKVTEVLPPEKAGVLTDHCVVLFEHNTFVSAPIKTRKFVYDYAKGDFEGLREALSAINLSSTVDHSNIDDDWRCWKDLFLAAVKDYIPLKKLKGRNPVPWIDGNILNLMKKKSSVRQKLKSHPSTGLREKFKTLRAKVKKLLRESREHFYDSIDTGFKSNPKRLWLILKLNSKSHPIPDLVSTATAPETTVDQLHNPPRESDDSPAGIADMFNRFFFLPPYLLLTVQ